MGGAVVCVCVCVGGGGSAAGLWCVCVCVCVWSLTREDPVPISGYDPHRCCMVSWRVDNMSPTSGASGPYLMYIDERPLIYSI